MGNQMSSRKEGGAEPSNAHPKSSNNSVHLSISKLDTYKGTAARTPRRNVTMTSRDVDKQRSLATSVVNIQKWLKGRYGALKSVKTISDKHLQSVSVQRLVVEADKENSTIDFLLDASLKYLGNRANLTLEADVENLRYLWQVYCEDLKSLDKQINSGFNQWSLVEQGFNVNLAQSRTKQKQHLDELRTTEFVTHDITSKENVPSKDLAYTRLQGGCRSSPRKRLSYHEPKENRDGRTEKLLMSLNKDGGNGDEIRAFNLEKNKAGSVKENETPSHHSNMEPLKELPVQPNVNIESGSKVQEVTVKLGQEILDLDFPTGPKRRRMNDDNSGNVSNRSSVVSSRSGSPSFLELLEDTRSRSSTPTGTASPCPQTLSEFKKRYKKDALWKSIKSNYQYLMDKEIIEACKLTENDLMMNEQDFSGHPKVSFAEFLQQYRELTDWLSQVETAMTKNVSSFSEKYLNQSYHEEMLERCPRRKLFNDYAKQLQVRYPDMKEEINARLQFLNNQWEELENFIATRNGQPDKKTMIRDLESDLNSLRQSLNTIEQRLLPLTVKPDWTAETIETKLKEHQGLQREIESRSKVVSAVLKLSGRLENEFESDSETDDGESRQLVAVNLERRWHGIWLLSLEWQCRLEEALNKKKGIYGSGLDFGNFRLPCLEESFASDNGKDSTNSSYGEFDDSFNFISCQRDVVGDTPSPTDIARLSLGKSSFLDKSSGDSANISEAESKMEESLQSGDSNEIISSEGEAEILQRTKNRIESKDVGYSSEGHSNDEAELLRLQMLEDRYQGLVQVASDSPLANETMKITDSSLNPVYYFMTTVDVDSTDKTTDNDEVGDNEKINQLNGLKEFQDGFDISPMKMAPNLDILKQADNDELLTVPIVTNGNHVVTSEQSESDYCIEPQEKIKLLIDQAEDLVRSPKPFFHSTPDKHELKVPQIKQTVPTSPSKQTQTLPIESSSVVETSCDASGEETDNESSCEEFSTASDDGGDAMVDSVICSDYTSASQESVSLLSPILPVDSVKLRNKTLSPRNGKDRPWSFMEVQEMKQLSVKKFSTSDGAIDKLTNNLTDSDSPGSPQSRNVALRQGSCSTFPRHRTKSRQTRRNFSSEFTSLRGAKRKLHYPSSESTLCCESQTDHVVPCVIRTDDELTPINPKDNFAELFANAILKASSGNSSLSESDTETSDEYDTAPLEPFTSENEDVLNSTGSFSENAWDNYQAPLYPTASEDPTEEPLHWEPTDEMEFDDEFCIPSGSLINNVMATQTNAQKKKVKNLPPTNQFEDSDSDIDDFYHILDQTELQLKKADQSLKKKRKDAMGTGLHLNPSKYAEILATCETNKICLESICQHMTTDAVTEADVSKIQDLLYQWEKLQALATERQMQSQELSSMFNDMADMKADQRNVQEALNQTSFSSAEELSDSIRALSGHQIVLENQQSQLITLAESVKLFSEDYPSINVCKYHNDIADITETNTELYKCVCRQVTEQQEKLGLWLEYLDSRKELEYLITQDRRKLQQLLCEHDSGRTKSAAELLNDIEDINCNLEVYESKLQCLSQLRSQLSCSSDDSAQRDYLASIADLRNQLFSFSKRCRDAKHNLDDEELRGDEVDITQYPIAAATVLEQTDFTDKITLDADAALESKPSKKKSWLTSCPLQLAALIMTAGLVYLMDPDVIDKITNFSVTINPELKYVSGPPPA